MTVTRLLPAFLLLVLLWGIPAATCAADQPRLRVRPPHARQSDAAKLSLYSPRLRRSAVMYLRLRLLELREEGLDRARLAIERRLSIDDLLRSPARPVPGAP